MSDTITPPEKEQPSQRSSRDRGGRLVVKSANTPLVVQLIIIVVAFVIALLVVTAILTHLDQPTSTPPSASGSSD